MFWTADDRVAYVQGFLEAEGNPRMADSPGRNLPDVRWTVQADVKIVP